MNKLQLMQRLGREVRDGIAKQAKKRVFGRLEKSFRFLANKTRVVVFSTYFWVRFVNDGRRAIRLRKPRQMIFFLDPKDDPRISTDYPRKAGKRRKLTESEFIDARERDLIVVTQTVKATRPTRFIEAGIRDARKTVPKRVLEAIRGDVRKLVKRSFNKITIRL